MHETIARSWFYAIIVENWGDRSGARFARSSPQCQRCANVGRFGGTLLLYAFAPGCDKTQWRGRTAKHG